MDSLRVSDEAAKAVQQTPNRVTLDSMLARIATVEYLHPKCQPTMTICVIELDNGFILVGQSAPADPDNFDQQVGERFSHENAIRQMWPLEGYLLREKLSK